MTIYYKFGYKFVAPSKTEHKKYDVYDVKTDKKIASFGDVRYEQYHDRIGHYKHLDHHNEARRRLYRLRHSGDIYNKDGGGYWAAKILW